MTRPSARSGARSSLDPLSIRTHAFGTMFLSVHAALRRSDRARSQGPGVRTQFRVRPGLSGRGVRGARSFRGSGCQSAKSRAAGQQPDHSGPAGACPCRRGSEGGGSKADSAGGRGGEAQILLSVRNRRRVCESWRPGHRVRAVSQGQSGSCRLHGLAWRRALDRSVPLGSALHRPPARHRAGSRHAIDRPTRISPRRAIGAKVGAVITSRVFLLSVAPRCRESAPGSDLLPNAAKHLANPRLRKGYGGQIEGSQ